MGIIKQLDTQLTNMIAAGEVVERPAGIIKELIDNSIDASSKNIIIETKQGGLEEILILDDGCGMDASDATMAFMRHATSKIANADDLWSIKTLGFRGEALPSISSVSKMQLITSNGKQSTCVKYEFGKLIEASPSSGNVGTKIIVNELFYKTPARLKHLKTPQYEASIIQDIITKFALGYPHIGFTYINDGRQIIKTLGNGQIKDVFFQIYGKEMASNTFMFSASDYDYSISGIACLPTFSRANRNYINIFINNRMIRYYKLQLAIIEAFHNYMPKERYPIVTINIEMDEKLVDVNVHPSKWEVRLSKENQLMALVKEAIVNALKSQMNAPIINLEKVAVKPVEYVQPVVIDLFEAIEKPSVDNNPYVVERVINQPSSTKIETVEEIREPYQVVVDEVIIKDDQSIENNFPIMQLIGQYDDKYILAGSKDGLYIIDQHAAEERVNFEYYTQLFNNKDIHSIGLLMPLKLTASPKVINNLDEINQRLESMGINFELFGDKDIIIREVPNWLSELKVEQFLNDLLDYYQNNDNFNIDELTKNKIATIACHSSIRFNHRLTYAEMENLIVRLSKAKNPFNCPHGRPTFTLITQSELEKSFKR